jgi:hypothetical protein
VIILFILLVGVWAAIVFPSVMNARRETPVNTLRTPDPAAADPFSVPERQAALARERVLARRRLALIGLIGGAIATLVGAIITGSSLLLIVSLVFDVLLAAYVGILLQIKQQRQQRSWGEPEPVGGSLEEPPVQVVSG